MVFEKHVQIRPEKFGAVIFETLREKVFITNETGAEILRLLEANMEPEKVIAELADNYGNDPERIKKEVQEFITELQANCIVRGD